MRSKEAGFKTVRRRVTCMSVRLIDTEGAEKGTEGVAGTWKESRKAERSRRNGRETAKYRL